MLISRPYIEKIKGINLVVNEFLISGFYISLIVSSLSINNPAEAQNCAMYILYGSLGANFICSLVETGIGIYSFFKARKSMKKARVEQNYTIYSENVNEKKDDKEID